MTSQPLGVSRRTFPSTTAKALSTQRAARSLAEEGKSGARYLRSQGAQPPITIRRRDPHSEITVEAPASTERTMHINGSDGAGVRRGVEDPDRLRCRLLHRDARRNRMPDSCTTSPPT